MKLSGTANLLRQELLVFVGVRHIGQRFGQPLDNVRRRTGAHNNRAELRQCHRNAQLVRGWRVLESRQALLAEYEQRPHLLVVEKGSDIACLLVERVGVSAEN